MIEVAQWGAPIATMIAASMTAANVGSRVTGWGFVLFTAASFLWCYIGLSSGQQNLLVANGFLTVVNMIGVWRWLGRQTKFEDGSQKAATRSSVSDVPSLYSAAGLVGRDVSTTAGIAIGHVVDAMLKCDGNEIAYVVITDGGGAGVGEKLRAVSPGELQFQPNSIQYRGTCISFDQLTVLETDRWPTSMSKPEPNAA